MKRRKVAYVLLVVGLFCVISGSVASFLVNLKEDKALTMERMVVVNDEFEKFSSATTSFETFRDELYTNVLSNMFYDTLAGLDVETKNQLSNYEAIVNDLEKKAISLNNLCSDVYYPDSTVNSKCINYKIIYEQVNNYFVSDINLYNKNIKSYNEYQTANGSASLLKEYKTKKKYVDYDGDKHISGTLDEEDN